MTQISTLSSWQHYASRLDHSQNFVVRTADGGAIECRYVRREVDYFIIYLSSHTGCRHACRFCHLTATGQTMMTTVNFEDFVEQATRVMEFYRQQGTPAQRVNFNFMARGEPLSNPTVCHDWPRLRAALAEIAKSACLEPVFNLSTIMPVDARELDLAKAFDGKQMAIYYSLYSLGTDFRRRWLPRAADAETSMVRLAEWQKLTGGDVCLHWALIEGENDGISEAKEIGIFARNLGLRAKFNLVRYNPFDASKGVEASEAGQAQYFDVLAGLLGSEKSRIVPRVGFDVKASCGMFVGPAGT